MHKKTRATKTRTAPGRLAWLDAYVARALGDVVRAALVVDVGFGHEPVTTLELARALAPLGARVIGVEQEPVLVERAQESEDARALGVRFREGGFDLGALLEGDGRPALVRLANVLRGYREEEVEPARALLGAALKEGGALLDATCDRQGAVGTALLLRRRADGLFREALVFGTDFSRGFAPRMFRDALPRDLRRRAQPGTPVGAFLDAWERAWREEGETPPSSSPPEGHGRRAPGSREALSARFSASVRAHPEMTLVDTGLAAWTPPGGVPLPATSAPAGRRTPGG